MKPGADLYARRWVRDFWIHQMKRKNAPNLPPNVTIEQFERHSETLAAALRSTKDKG